MSGDGKMSVRSARRRAATQVVDKSIDRVYDEVANLDGPDGLMSASELYVAILLVFNDLNKYVPGGHINPPKRKKVAELLKKFDLDQNGKLDREEFGKLVRASMPTLVRRMVTHVLIYCTAVPLLVWVTKKAVAEIPGCHKIGPKLPGGLLAVFFTLCFKITGILSNK